MNTLVTFTTSSIARQLLLTVLLPIAMFRLANAQVVYSNDFESNTSGLTASGSLSTLSTTSLPTDSGGLTSVNQSTWLGRLGENVSKSGSLDEIVTLNLSSLTVGQTYLVAFDLFIGASWDGSAESPYGPDSWRFAVNGTPLVNTTFSNIQYGINGGVPSPQRYSDTTYTSTTGPDFNRSTGAEASHSLNGGSDYSQEYSIYYFGHGTGNPVLSFVATGTTAALEFARYGATTDSSDEYWALDNVQVASVPEPSAFWLLAAGTGLWMFSARIFRKSGG